MATLDRSFGVDYTIIKNLTGERHYLVWFPAAHGYGRWIEPRERIRFSGNLLEAITGSPSLRDKLNADVRAGRIAVAVCGAPEYDYTEEASVQFAPHLCFDWTYESSSSTWVGGVS